MGRTGALKSVILLALTGVASQLGCGPLQYAVPSSSVAPGADAKIVADVRKKQSQTVLEIEAKNLVPPDRIVEKGSQYVVWYRRDPDATWSRVGALVYDEEAREGSLNGSVPETAFDLEISAESDSVPASPSSTILFAQRVEEK